MNWDAVSAVGQIVGALAVVISLIYLAVQMRQNTRAVRGTSFQAVTDAFNQFNLSIAHDKELARIFRLGSQGIGNLDEDQQIQFAFLCLSAVRIFDTMYHQSKLGTGELGLWRAEERALATLLQYPGIRAWWATNPLSVTEEFRTYIERVLLQRG